MRKHEKERERERERIIQPLVRSITNLYIPPSSRLHSTCTNIVNSGSHLPGVPCLLHRGENGSIRAEAFASCSPSNESLNTPWLSCSIGAAPGTWKRWEGKRGGVWRKQQRRKSGNRGACASPVVVRGKRREPVMGTLIEQFAHVPWNSRNLLRRLTMYRIPACGAALRMNRADRLDWPCFGRQSKPSRIKSGFAPGSTRFSLHVVLARSRVPPNSPLN